MAPPPELTAEQILELTRYIAAPPTQNEIANVVVSSAMEKNGVNIGGVRSVVTDVENFEAMSKRELSDRVSSFTPAMANEYSAAWTQFSKSIDAASRNLAAAQSSAGGRGFEGPVPDKVREVHQAFTKSTEDLAEVVGSPSATLDGFGGTLSSVHTNLPVLLAQGPPDALLAPDPLAISLMEFVYSPAVLDAGGQLPVLPGPIDLAFGAAAGDAPGGQPPASGAGAAGSAEGLTGGNGSHGSVTPTDPADPADPTAPGGPAVTDGAGAGGAGADTTTGTGAPTSTALNGAGGAGGPSSIRSGDETAITQAGLSPDSALGQSGRGTAAPGAGLGGTGVGGTGGFAPGAVPMAGTGGGHSAGGSGSGAGGKISGAPAPGALPRVPGLGVGSAGGAGEAGTNNAMAGRRGLSGGMLGGGGRGREEEDDAYTPAEFLTTIDNGDKLIGPLPRVVHPVIGAWR